MTFSLGRPMVVLALVAVASGVMVCARRPAARSGGPVVWTFAEVNAPAYRGQGVDVEVISPQALDLRLMTLFMSPQTAGDAPDLCEIEIGSVGKFLQPADGSRSGLLPLNSYLEQSGDLKRILPARLSVWTRDGEILGIPRDVHPVTITYRKDLFAEAGVDLAKARTWGEFEQMCLAYQRHFPGRRAMELSGTSSDTLSMLLLQRGIDLVDANNGVHLTDAKVRDTVAFYARMVAGDEAIGLDAPAGGEAWAEDLIAGDAGAIFTADWKLAELQRLAESLGESGALRGKLAMMALPRFDPVDSPTSTWGGTMVGIPRACADPDRAWTTLRKVFLTHPFDAHILPATPDLWGDAMFHRIDPDFGMSPMEIYIQLAPLVPNRVVTPYTMEAQIALGLVMYRAKRYVEAHGTDGLDAACADLLAEAQRVVEQRIRLGGMTR